MGMHYAKHLCRGNNLPRYEGEKKKERKEYFWEKIISYHHYLLILVFVAEPLSHANNDVL